MQLLTNIAKRPLDGHIRPATLLLSVLRRLSLTERAANGTPSTQSRNRAIVDSAPAVLVGRHPDCREAGIPGLLVAITRFICFVWPLLILSRRYP